MYFCWFKHISPAFANIMLGVVFIMSVELITQEQLKAINRLNAALKNAKKNGIWIAGMDGGLYYSTQQSIDKFKKDGRKGIYSNVANCNVHSDEGSGQLYSEGYEDSGGW